MSTRNMGNLPQLLIVILIGALLIVNLVPELRTEVNAVTNISGASLTILGYIGVALVAGFTLLIVKTFLGGRTRLLSQKVKLKLYRSFSSLSLPAIAISVSGVSSINGAIVAVVGMVVVLIIGVNFLDEMAGQIGNATTVNGSLENTLEGTLLDNWVLIIVASIVLGVLTTFMGSRAVARRRRR